VRFCSLFCEAVAIDEGDDPNAQKESLVALGPLDGAARRVAGTTFMRHHCRLFRCSRPLRRQVLAAGLGRDDRVFVADTQLALGITCAPFSGGISRQLTGFRRVSIVNMTHSEGKPVATTVSAAKAKAEFAECIRKAEAGDPVVITRHGRAVVALVRADRLQQLERLGSAGPAAGLAGLVGGWPGSEELVRLVVGSRRTKARRVPRLGR